jgi:hypothetical protein
MHTRLFATTLLLLPLLANAELGGNAAAVQPNSSQLHATMHAAVSNGYTVHEILSEGGLRVREYANPAGRIFAVSWEGPVLPDLPQLLGAYFPTFKQAAIERRQAGVRGGPVAVAKDDLVVESGGRMRAYAGRAWVPSLLPPHITIDEIR